MRPNKFHNLHTHSKWMHWMNNSKWSLLNQQQTTIKTVDYWNGHDSLSFQLVFVFQNFICAQLFCVTHSNQFIITTHFQLMCSIIFESEWNFFLKERKRKMNGERDGHKSIKIVLLAKIHTSTLLTGHLYSGARENWIIIFGMTCSNFKYDQWPSVELRQFILKQKHD